MALPPCSWRRKAPSRCSPPAAHGVSSSSPPWLTPSITDRAPAAMAPFPPPLLPQASSNPSSSCPWRQFLRPPLRSILPAQLHFPPWPRAPHLAAIHPCARPSPCGVNRSAQRCRSAAASPVDLHDPGCHRFPARRHRAPLVVNLCSEQQPRRVVVTPRPSLVGKKPRLMACKCNSDRISARLFALNDLRFVLFTWLVDDVRV
jgi:hypothetical protein